MRVVVILLALSMLMGCKGIGKLHQQRMQQQVRFCDLCSSDPVFFCNNEVKCDRCALWNTPWFEYPDATCEEP